MKMKMKDYRHACKQASRQFNFANDEHIVSARYVADGDLIVICYDSRIGYRDFTLETRFASRHLKRLAHYG